jgi:hypothetical protein
MAFVKTVREIEHHDVVCAEICTDKLPDKHSRKWMKQASITFEEATEAYMVEVTAEFHCKR